MKDRPDTPGEARIRAMIGRQILGNWPIKEDLPALEAALDEAVEKIAAYNAAMEPVEDDFLAQVERLRDIGYGRMIQLILGEWDKRQPGILAHWERNLRE